MTKDEIIVVKKSVPYIDEALYCIDPGDSYYVGLLIPTHIKIPKCIKGDLEAQNLEGWKKGGVEINIYPFLDQYNFFVLWGSYILFPRTKTKDSEKINEIINQIQNYNNNEKEII